MDFKMWLKSIPYYIIAGLGKVLVVEPASTCSRTLP